MRDLHPTQNGNYFRSYFHSHARFGNASLVARRNDSSVAWTPLRSTPRRQGRRVSQCSFLCRAKEGGHRAGQRSSTHIPERSEKTEFPVEVGCMRHRLRQKRLLANRREKGTIPCRCECFAS